ncbi:Outer membrane protein beta-barrel domain-containing protein [Hymenobacter daecheongensis DSM 21074]|uniref:Outer membrane protein beta-barrel domain-containing protein n=1 Tax=Hymenobacter daecheongensis DSM 21074 TaxID=1121955 RepID=A0A1M6L4F9_9BACT|nr:porin family protein [Hymenobacter daecheongensis]SHJ66097.1 Outer membrane protein beta-barrel domain-containing protein [Hymenobacter daecheongensis DSM 21074]
MKKITLLLALALASLTTVAQEAGKIGPRSSSDYAGGSGGHDSRNTGFGVKGGFNLADVYGDNKKNYTNGENYKAFHAGVYGQYGFSDKFSVQPELLYSRQGFKGTSTYTNPGGTTTATVKERRLDYVQVPVLLVFNVLDNVSIHAGPQFSLLTKVTEDGKERKIANENNSYGYSYSSIDYGIAAGAEARVGPARVGARYTAGFADVIKDQQSLASTGNKALDNIKNSLFQVYVGVGFAR